MTNPNVQVQLSIKEIYDAVCEECKKKVREAIKEKLTDQMVDQVIA